MLIDKTIDVETIYEQLSINGLKYNIGIIKINCRIMNWFTSR